MTAVDIDLFAKVRGDQSPGQFPSMDSEVQVLASVRVRS